MDIRGKVFPEVSVERLKVPEFESEVKCTNGIVRAVLQDSNGKKFDVRVDCLKTKNEAEKLILHELFWELAKVKENLNMSKAEMKRELIKYEVISK